MIGDTLRNGARSLVPQYLLTTPLEQELQESDAESTLFHKYAVNMTVPTSVGPTDIHTVQILEPNTRQTAQIPSIVLVHGLGGQTSNFNELAQDLSQFSSVVAIDLPGHGKSPDPQNWDAVLPEISVQIIEYVICNVLREGAFIIIGHSYGSCHALRVGASLPLKERCKAVITITPPFRSDLWKYQRLITRWFPAFAFDLGFRSFDRRGELRSPSVNRSVAASASDKVRTQQLHINLQSRTSTVLQTVSRIKFFDPLKEVRPECPILVIGAEEDQICPTKQASALYKALGQPAQFAQVPLAGHSVLLEQPEKVNELISQFIRELFEVTTNKDFSTNDTKSENQI